VRKLRQHPAAPPEVMTTTELAEYLQIHPSTLYRMLRKGQIPGFKIGSDYRFNRNEIEQWIADLQTKV
jgi:excisionase family DNA binding protein